MSQFIMPLVPPGVNIRTDYSPTNNYAIPQSQTDCWPTRLAPLWQQVVITALQNTYWSQQQGTMRAWLSINPNGINVLPALFENRSVRLGALGNSWCFYSDQLQASQAKEAQIQFPVNPTQLGDGDIPAYWFNIQNLDNKENAYYLQWHYYSQSADFIQ